METPFVFGRIATDKNFTDRVAETEMLVQNFQLLTNTIIISPRRWGKSSLVNKAAQQACEADEKLRIAVVDLFNVRSEGHFYALLAQAVIRACSAEAEIEFDLDRVRENPDEILDLAEKLAVAKDIKVVVCIDEFQNIASFTDPDYFQRRLRSHWQTHQHVAYCLYGSQRHMMLEVFTESSKPFYKFGNLMFLEKIGAEYLAEFFMQRFSETGKEISEESAQLIAELTNNHPYYAQQLAQLSWLRTKTLCTPEIVKEAHA